MADALAVHVLHARRDALGRMHDGGPRVRHVLLRKRSPPEEAPHRPPVAELLHAPHRVSWHTVPRITYATYI